MMVEGVVKGAVGSYEGNPYNHHWGLAVQSLVWPMGVVVQGDGYSGQRRAVKWAVGARLLPGLDDDATAVHDVDVQVVAV